MEDILTYQLGPLCPTRAKRNLYLFVFFHSNQSISSKKLQLQVCASWSLLFLDAFLHFQSHLEHNTEVSFFFYICVDSNLGLQNQVS